jgi:hypothetical protein
MATATAKNREAIRNLKAEILRKNNTMNNVAAELKAIRNYAKLSPKPSSSKRTPPPTVVVVKATRGSPAPLVSFTSTPRRRPRVGTKLCTSYTKSQLERLMKRLGHRVNAKTMTVASMCSRLRAPPPTSSSSYKRPLENPTVNVRKNTYEKHLKKNLYKLAKNVGISVKSTAKKGEIVNKIRAKINKNISDALKNMSSNVTARQISEKLAKNYGWKNDRHVERVSLLKIYRNMK